jgi:hypothetical protein
MGFYFEDHLSMFASAGLQVEKTLDAIMRRYRMRRPTGPTSNAVSAAARTIAMWRT